MSTRAFLASLLVLCCAGTARAAVINWGAATTIAGDSDVSTTGTLVAAFNTGAAGVAATTVNGVTFNPFAVDPLFAASETVGNFTLATANPGGLSATTGTVGSGSAPFSGLSASYQALLASAAAAGNVGVSSTLTMTGLTVGQAYEFQWWANQAAFSDPNGTTATAGNSVTLDWNSTDAAGGVGQFAIGTFTADSTSQVITFTSASQSLINGFQLRQAAQSGPSAVPLPAAVWAGLALGGVVLRRARRGRVVAL